MGIKSLNNPTPSEEKPHTSTEPITLDMVKNNEGIFEVKNNQENSERKQSNEKINHEIELEVGSMIKHAFVNRIIKYARLKNVAVSFSEKKYALSSVIRIKFNGRRDDIVAIMEDIKNVANNKFKF